MNLLEIDTFLFSFINSNLQNKFLDAFMPVITDKYYILILLLVLWLLIRDKKNAAIQISLVIASVALSDWTSDILKHLIERQRPCHALEGVNLLVGCGSSFSMPSNHAANAFAMVSALSYQSKRLMRWLLVSVAVLVGFSRVYVGVHYPSDVIAGAFIGLIISIFVIYTFKWLSLRYSSKPYNTALLISLLSISLFRIYYITHGVIDLSNDEAHYWEWSKRLGLSYYSKGPMIAYLIAFGTSVFGDNVFGIRIMAVVFSALSSILLYKLVKRLFDERSAAAAAILMQIIPLYSAYGVLFTMDAPFLFFWILSLLLFWKAVNAGDIMQDARYTTQDTKLNNLASDIAHHELGLQNQKSGIKAWLFLGISIGLGLLTKYTMAFFYLCAFLFLLNSKQHRHLLFTRQPYISLLLSLLVFSPVIIWNAANDWVTLRHTAGQAHVADGFNISISSLVEFIGSQFGVITPVFFILVLYSLFKLKGEHKGNFLFWFSIPVLTFFLLKSIQAKVQANWPLTGYVTGIVAFTVFFIGRWALIKKWLRYAVIAGGVLSLGVTALAHYTPLILIKLPVKMDPSSRVRGWKELGEEVSRLSDELSAKGQFFIFSDRYQVSSELAFYVKGHPVTYCVNLGRRMNQYDLWPGFDNLSHFNAIFVTIGDVKVPDVFTTSFSRCEKKIFNAYIEDRILREYSIFTCYDFKGMLQKEILSY